MSFRIDPLLTSVFSTKTMLRISKRGQINPRNCCGVGLSRFPVWGLCQDYWEVERHLTDVYRTKMDNLSRTKSQNRKDVVDSSGLRTDKAKALTRSQSTRQCDGLFCPVKVPRMSFVGAWPAAIITRIERFRNVRFCNCASCG